MPTRRGTKPQQEKLKDLDDSIRADKALILHYEDALRLFNERMNRADAEIITIRKRMAELTQEFDEAPKKLETMRKHLAKTEKKRADLLGEISGVTSKVKRHKKLKEQLANLEREIKAEEINIDEVAEKAKTTE